ncbi:type IV toxin-antitoxin system AbiEi family antitoxin domain-containing protein [Candidatus Palauibacter sp.]|uniref:type IV toxin-antitoxin system AbiEi family antitoxin domain-containing protein n=1 Tax=Candidatus Palauibacter sp. TaxID=3101350 RepID=UPI003B51F3C6
MIDPAVTDTQRLRDADLPAFFRPQDAEAAGIPYGHLRRMEEAGLVEREGWGLYRRTDADFSRHHSLAAVCARVPSAIVSLITALSVHEIGTQIPFGAWIAIPHGDRTPTVEGFRLNVTRFSGASLRYGVVETEFEGVPARITTPARTVVDCFRFRNKVGLNVALEALDDALLWKKVTRDEVGRVAEACRAQSLLEPLLYPRFL